MSNYIILNSVGTGIKFYQTKTEVSEKMIENPPFDSSQIANFLMANYR